MLEFNKNQSRAIANALRGEVPSLPLYECTRVETAIQYCFEHGPSDMSREDYREIIVDALLEFERGEGLIHS